MEKGQRTLPQEVLEKIRNKKQHPLYTTESSQYGTVPRGIDHKVISPEFSRGSSDFTNTFSSGPRVPPGGLKTGMPKHRYLKELDGFQ